MSLSPLLLRLRHRPDPLPAALTAARSMGGGPRTFPGGLNKWQYKRMHEKLAKEKEKRLLHLEKQLYQARLRSEIRAKVAARASGVSSGQAERSDAPNFAAMSSKEHIKALANRFMKQGAEDIWNEDDGPVSERRRPEQPAKPLDLEKIVSDARSSIGKLGSFEQRREYSKWRRNLSSDEEDEDGDCGGLIRKELKISRFGEEDVEEGEEIAFGSQRTKKMMSGAALRTFDAKKERRARRGNDNEEDLSEQIQRIREEIRCRDSSSGPGMEQIRRIREEIRCRDSSSGHWTKQYEVKGGSVLTHKR